jgi:pyruvate/2-oxoglutarate dehydrogenase complex dihydrolipoamide acyltransferase (E2) component
LAVTKVVMPRLFEAMARGTICAWRKQAGDRIRGGDLLVEIETDAADLEVEAAGAGVLRAILVPAGDTAPVGTLLGVIAEPGDDLAALLATAEAPGGSAGDRTREQPETVSSDPSRRLAPAESVRALVVASERRCSACGKPLTRRQRLACSAKCRATLSRRRQDAARRAQLQDVTSLLQAALAKLRTLDDPEIAHARPAARSARRTARR